MPDKIQLSPPPDSRVSGTNYILQLWLNELHARVGSGPFGIQGYESGSLPNPSEYGSNGSDPFSSLIYVKGSGIYYSNGTAWIALSGVPDAGGGGGTIDPDTSIVLVNTSSGDQFVTLPTTPEVSSISIKKITSDGNDVVVQAEDGALIDNDTSARFSSPLSSFSFAKKDGSWWVI